MFYSVLGETSVYYSYSVRQIKLACHGQVVSSLKMFYFLLPKSLTTFPLLNRLNCSLLPNLHLSFHTPPKFPVCLHRSVWFGLSLTLSLLISSIYRFLSDDLLFCRYYRFCFCGALFHVLFRPPFATSHAQPLFRSPFSRFCLFLIRPIGSCFIVGFYIETQDIIWFFLCSFAMYSEISWCFIVFSHTALTISSFSTETVNTATDYFGWALVVQLTIGC